MKEKKKRTLWYFGITRACKFVKFTLKRFVMTFRRKKIKIKVKIAFVPLGD